MEKDKLEQPVKLIVICGSAGSLKVIFKILDSLKRGYQIPMLIVLHRDPQGASRLSEIITVRSNQKVKEIEDKDSIEDNHLYICPADYHVLIESNGSFSLDYSEKENFSRPSLDVTFRSAADAYGPQLLCVLLSGANADGAIGLSYVKHRKGITVVQDPKDAEVSYMPEQAILLKEPDYVLPGSAIGGLLNSLRKD
jgi:two-component system chemotaxis response regulator CheB